MDIRFTDAVAPVQLGEKQTSTSEVKNLRSTIAGSFILQSRSLDASVTDVRHTLHSTLINIQSDTHWLNFREGEKGRKRKGSKGKGSEELERTN